MGEMGAIVAAEKVKRGFASTDHGRQNVGS